MIDFKTISSATKDNLPAILTAAACVGTITTAVLSYKAHELAVEKIADFSEENIRIPDGLDWKERFGISWQVYIPPAIAGIATIACIIGANRVQAARGAAFALAYAGSEQAFARYRQALEEVGGKKAIEEVKNKVAQKAINDSDQKPVDTILVAGGDGVLCYDIFSGRYFQSDIETIRRVSNNINYQLNNESYASLNEFYAGLDLPPIAAGDLVGWSEPNSLSVEFSSQLDPKGRPVLAIDFLVAPRENYFKIN